MNDLGFMKKQFENEIKLSTRKLANRLTNQELMDLLVTPLIIGEVIWTYADKVTGYAAAHKIAEFKTFTRLTKKVHAEWDAFVRKDLKHPMSDLLREKAAVLLTNLSFQFATLWYTVNNELKKVHPDDPYLDMRTDANICILVINFYNQHYARMIQLVNRKGIPEDRVDNPFFKSLYMLMGVFAVKADIEYSPHFTTWLKAFQNYLSQYDFVIDDFMNIEK